MKLHTLRQNAFLGRFQHVWFGGKEHSKEMPEFNYLVIFEKDIRK